MGGKPFKNKVLSLINTAIDKTVTPVFWNNKTFAVSESEISAFLKTLVNPVWPVTMWLVSTTLMAVNLSVQVVWWDLQGWIVIGQCSHLGNGHFSLEMRELYLPLQSENSPINDQFYLLAGLSPSITQCDINSDVSCADKHIIKYW